MDLACQRILVGASAGVALFPVDAEDIESLIQAADGAMYTAKGLPGSDIRLLPETDSI